MDVTTPSVAQEIFWFTRALQIYNVLLGHTEKEGRKQQIKMITAMLQDFVIA